MSTNFTNVTPILGVNLEGNEAQSTGTDGVIQIPRVPFLTPVLISGNRSAIYVQTKASMNPGTTVTLERSSADGGGTVVATTGTGTYISLNTTAASSGDCIWVRTITNIGS